MYIKNKDVNVSFYRVLYGYDVCMNLTQIFFCIYYLLVYDTYSVVSLKLS